MLAIMIHLSLGVGNSIWRSGNATYYLEAACMHTKDTVVFAAVKLKVWVPEILVCHTTRKSGLCLIYTTRKKKKG